MENIQPEQTPINMLELVQHIKRNNRRLILFEHMMRTAPTTEERLFALDTLNQDIVPTLYNAFARMNQLAGHPYVNLNLLPTGVQDARFYYLVNLNRQLQGLPTTQEESIAPIPKPNRLNEPGM